MERQQIMPFQPYVQLAAEKYQRMERRHLGISHYYEFGVNNQQIQNVDAVPDDSVDLLFNLGRDGVRTYISGTVFQAKHWEMGEEGVCFGVRFLPGEAVLPRELSMEMLTDSDLEIDGNLFGEDLEERIAYADTMEDRASIFEVAYEELLRKEEEENMKKNVAEYMLRRMNETFGQITMKELTEETHYSACYLRRIFKTYQGIAPKPFAQFLRFQYLLHETKRNRYRYDEMALACGYFDEAHMMKEFKKYAGVTLDTYKQMIQKCNLKGE